MSIFRGTRSPIHNLENALAGASFFGAAGIRIALDKAKIVLLDPRRRDLRIGHDLFERLGLRKCGLLV
jgi:hypothetical protein